MRGEETARARLADAQLRGLVARPWPTVAATLEGLRAVDAWGRRHGDLRGVFATAYAVVTVVIEAALEAGEFSDAAWVERLVVDFADRYRRALAGDVAAGDPAVWGRALARRGGGSVAAIVALVHGMIAHVHFDLPRSLCACAPVDRRRGADYERLGARICGATAAVQRAVLAAHAPALAPAHARLGGVDTRLTAGALRAWRGRALDVAAAVAEEGRWARRLGWECAALAFSLDVAAWPLERALALGGAIAGARAVARGEGPLGRRRAA